MTESVAEPPAGGDPAATPPDALLDPPGVPEDPGVDEGLDLSDGDAEAIEALRAALDCLHGDQFDDIIEAVRAAARAEDLALSTPEGVSAAFAQVIAELQARGVRVDGQPISGPLDVLGWMARGIEAVEHGEPYFDLDPGRPDAARMFWAGDVINPATGEYVAADPGAPAGEDNRLSNKHFANVVSSQLWQEGVAATPVTETPDGRLINKLGLGRQAVGDYLSGLIDSMEATGTAAADMSLMWRIGGGGGSGRSSKAAVKSFGNVVDQFLHTQYGLQTGAAISSARAAGAVAPAVGVVTQGAYAGSAYAQQVAPVLRGAERSVVYMAQGRTAGGAPLAPAASRPRPVTAAELAAAAPVAAAGGAAAGQVGAAGVAGTAAAGAGAAGVAGAEAGVAAGGAVAAGGVAAGGAAAGGAAAVAAAAAEGEDEKQSVFGKLWDRAKPGGKTTASDVMSGKEAAKLAKAEGGEPAEQPVAAQFRGNQAAKVAPAAEPPRAPQVEPPPVHVVDSADADEPLIDLRATPPAAAATPPAVPPAVPPVLPPVVPPAAASAPQHRPAQPPHVQPGAQPGAQPPAAPAARHASPQPSPNTRPPAAAQPPAAEPPVQPSSARQPLPPLQTQAAPPPQGDLAAPLPAAEAQRARDLLDRARKAREQARGRGGSSQPRERRASLPQEQPRPRQSPRRPSQ